MDVELYLQRRPTIAMRTTFGRLENPDRHRICDTLEDCVREIPGVPVAEWKIYAETAIPAGRFEVVFIDSPHFGPGTLHLVDVPGFDAVHIHGGMSAKDTKGCIVVGDSIDEGRQTIAGAQLRNVLQKLKDYIRGLMVGGNRVWLNVLNAEASA